jgi:hypothetical protein
VLFGGTAHAQPVAQTPASAVAAYNKPLTTLHGAGWMPDSKDDTSGSNNDCDGWRERLLFIGTQFSNLYTALLCAGRALPWAGPWRRTFSHRARLQWRLGWYNWEGAWLVVGADGLSANTDRYVVCRVDYGEYSTPTLRLAMWPALAGG